jgi:LmbE family N-acetylglucosaminyl deacetylase
MISSHTYLVIVAPHPDDETIALGGTIHDHVRSGGAVEIIAVTDGEAADEQADEQARRRLAIRRDGERRQALARLGAVDAEIVRLRLPDREVGQYEPELAGILGQRFAAIKAKEDNCLVSLTWREDPHPDHRAAARAGIEAASLNGLPYIEVPIWASYENRSLPTDRILYRPITAEGQRAKRDALRAFRSQTEPLPGERGPVLPSDFFSVFDQSHELILR